MKKTFIKTVQRFTYSIFLISILFNTIEIFAQRLAPGVPTLVSPSNNAYLQPGKTVQFTWNAPTSGSTPFSYEIYIYNGSSWSSYNAGSDLYYNYLVQETGGSSLCGAAMQWYIKVTNAYGTNYSSTWNFTPYPKFSGSSADYTITPSTSCQSAGTHSIATSQAKYYSFSATSGYTYYFGTCNTGMGCGTNTAWDTYLRIYGTDNSCTISAYDDNSGSCGNGTSYIAWTCTTSGTYYLQVTGKTSSNYGTYYLQYLTCIPRAVINYDPDDNPICVGTSVTFLSESSVICDNMYVGDLYFEWNFNGFGGANIVTLNHPNQYTPIMLTPTIPGVYTISLCMYDIYTDQTYGDCDEITITVIDVPQLSFTYNSPQCDLTYCFTGEAEFVTPGGGGIPYPLSWDWGDGSTPSLSNPNVLVCHTYTTAGTYQVTLSAENDCGPSSISETIEVGSLCNCTATQTNDINNLSPNVLYELNSNVSLSTGSLTLTDVSIRMRNSVPITITIQNGATLTLDHCHLFGCDNMWQGIAVNGGGTLRIINGTLIEDAIIGVDIHNGIPISLLIDGSTLNKNETGINIANIQQATTYPFHITNSVFTCRNLNPLTDVYLWPMPSSPYPFFNLNALESTTAGTLSEHYWIGIFGSATLLGTQQQPALRGITLNAVGTLSGGIYSEAIINGDDPSIGGTTINIFDNLLYGVFAYNSNVTCQNNAFQYIKGTTSPEGSAILAINSSQSLPLSVNRLQVNKGTGTSPRNNYFYDCKAAINVLNYDVVNIENVNIRSDQTTGLSEGVYGVVIQTPQSSEIKIDSNTISNVLYGILFYGLNVSGSQNIHGIFEIDENTIQANLDGINGSVTTENVSIGIVVSSLLYNSDNENDCNELFVINNHLYNVRNGIQMENWFYLNMLPYMPGCDGNRPVIENNYILLVDPDNTSQFGINTSQNSNGIISNNNVQGFSNASLGYWGIRCASNIVYGAVQQIVQCNNVVNTGIGIEFDDDQFGTTFFNNTMDGSQYGFVLGPSAVLGTQGTNQGTDHVASDNRWTESTYTGTGHYKTFTVGSYPIYSELIVVPISTDPDRNPQDLTFPQTTYNFGYPSTPINFLYSPVYGLTDLIGLNTNSVNCSTPDSKSVNANSVQITSQGNGSIKHIKWLERLVEDSVNLAVFPVEQHINDMFRIYRMIEAWPELKDSSAILKQFHHIAKNGHIGALVNIESALADGQLSQSISDIASVIPQNNIESNFIDFYNVYIHYKDSTYSVADSIMLKTLVDGCAVRDGIAVLKARTLYSMIYRDFTIYPDNCVDNSSNKIATNLKKDKTNLSNLTLDVYPNPNNSTFTISLIGNNSTSETAEVSIYNVIGNLMSVLNLELKNNSSKFDAGLSNGIYFITVKDDKGNVYKSEKIIVIK